MQKINDRIQDVLKQHKTKKQYLFVLFLLSAMVIAAVCFSLMTPAVSMSGQLVCTKVPHSHGDACYERHIICNENAEAHTHSDDCYTTEAVLQCENTDEGHEHTEECYKEEKVLTCGLEEKTAHEHTQDCYEVELTCDREVHEHSHACYSGDAGIAVITLYEEEEQTAAMPAGIMQNEYAINDDEKEVLEWDDNALKFKDCITKLDYIGLGDIVEDEDDGELKRIVDFKVNYHIDEGKLSDDGRLLIYELPDNVRILENDEKDLIELDGKTSKDAGRFRLIPDHKLVVLINKDYAENGTKQIDGYIQFSAEVGKTDNNNGYENVKFGEAETPIPFNDLQTSKECDSGQLINDGKTEEIKYDITIKSKNGSGEGSININDVFSEFGDTNDHLSIQNIEIYKVDLDDSNEVVENSKQKVDIQVTPGNEGYDFTLPYLLPKEGYTISYTAQLTAGEADLFKTKNTVTATANLTDNSNKGVIETSASADFNKDFRLNISKQGEYDPLCGKIKWTITVDNPGKQSLLDKIITDEMFNTLKDGELKVKYNYWYDDYLNINDVGVLDGDKFTFKDVNEAQYVFQYITEAPEEKINAITQAKENGTENQLTDDDKTVSNVVSLNEPNKSASAVVPLSERSKPNSPPNKKCDKENYDFVEQSKQYIIPWEVELEGYSGAFADKTYKDEISAEGDGTYHYMTNDQYDEIKVFGCVNEFGSSIVTEKLNKDSDYTIECTRRSDNNILAFEIKFKNIDEKYTNIKIKYSTIGEASNMENETERKCKNNAIWNNTPREATFTINKPLEKAGPYTETQYLAKQDGHYILSGWKITLDLKRYEEGQPITLTDTLPEGLELKEDSVKCYNDNGENTLDVNPQINENNKQIITFTIPAERDNTKPCIINYDTIMTKDNINDYPKSMWAQDVIQLDNTVSDDKGNNAIGIASITIVPEKQISKKVNLDVDEEQHYAYEPTNSLEFEIYVNPTQDQIDAKQNITVKDTFNNTAGVYCNLLEVNVFDVDTGEELVKGKDYSYQEDYDDPEKTIITFSVPPRRLRIVYEYYCDYFTYADYIKNIQYNEDNGGWYYWYDRSGNYNGIQKSEFESLKEGEVITNWNGSQYIIDKNKVDTGVKIKNDVEIVGTDEKASVDNQYFLFNAQSYNAGGVAVKPPQIKKTDADNDTQLLSGAQFVIYKWNEGKWLIKNKNNTWAEENGNNYSNAYKLVTGKDGTVTLGNLLEVNTLYQIKEIKAPDGYLCATKPYYFIYNTNSFSGIDLDTAGITEANVLKIHDSRSITIPNRKILPATGGVGSEPIIFIGMSIMTSSAIIYFLSKGRKRRTKR